MKKTIIKDIHIDMETGNLNVLLHKRVLDDQGNVIAQGNHRCVIHPDTDIDAQAKAINDHFTTGQVPVNNEASGLCAASVDMLEWDSLKAHAALVRTPEVLKRWNDQKEARLAEKRIKALLHSS